MDIGAPTTVTFTTQFGAPSPAVPQGEVVEAQVLQVLAEGRARLAIATTIIDVHTPVALVAGTTVRLAVKNTPDGLRVALLDPGHANGAKSVVPLVVDATARAALTTALPGLAGAPGPATAARTTAPAAPNLSPATSTTIGMAAPDLPTLSSPSLTPAPSPMTGAAVLAQAVRTAAARQSGLAPLFADLAVAVASPALPQAVRLAAGQVMAKRLPITSGVSADTLAKAVAGSGLFLETGLAAGQVDTAPADDLKAALLVLRHVLKSWMGVEAGGKAGPPELPGVPVPVSVPAAAAHDLPRTPATVPPPYRGAPTTAQSEVVPLIGADMAAEDIGHVLLRDCEGAIGRQTLLQAASLPERAAHSDPAQGARWNFEIPFALGQRTALAQFEIARDGHAVPAEGIKAVWRARFSIDVEPLGAVHAQVALIGERAAVTLWAERAEAAAQIRDNAAALTAALTEADFAPDILVRDGVPPRPREAIAPAGRFLDCAS